MVVILTQLNGEDWTHLHELAKSMYLDGACYEFAIALHRGLGWNLFGIMCSDVIRHAVVQHPREPHLWRDVRGAVTRADVGTPFGVSAQATIRLIQEDDLRAVRPVTEHDIANATRIAQRLWPELPWKEPQDHKVLAFALELEVLSRKHGIWIRSSVPAQQPHLAMSDGEDEFGYILSPTANVTGYTIDRHFKK